MSADPLSADTLSPDTVSQDGVAVDPVELWASSSFLDDAQAWVTAELAPRGVRLIGEWAQPHVRGLVEHHPVRDH